MSNFKKQITVIILLFFLSSTSSLQAQDPRIYQDDWFLESLIIDNIEYTSPASYLVAKCRFVEFDLSLSHPFCKSYTFFEGVDFVEEAEFNLTAPPIYLGGICGDPVLNNFISLHNDIFSEDGITLNNTFNYSIEEKGDNLQLTITNVDSNLAIYSNILLTVNEFEPSEIRVYPNPTKDFIYIEYPEQIINIRVYSLQGQLLMTALESNRTLDISTYKSGVYFVEIETIKGTTIYEIIKQ